MKLCARTRKVTAGPGRRVVIGIGLACAAVLFPAAALAATGSGAAGPAGRCLDTHTQAWIGQPGDNGAGSSEYQLEFSNVGRTACTFLGYPRVIALDRQGHQVGLPALRASSARPLITLRPGDTVHVVLNIRDPFITCRRPVSTTMLLVYPPGQVKSQLVPLASGACAGKTTMSVDAAHQGAGIPRHTSR